MMQKLTGRLAFFKPRILYVVKIPPYSIRSLSKDHSKLEKTLRLLREDEQKKIEEEEKRIKLIASSSVSPPVKPSIKVRIIQELKHYYHGFRLLALETRLSAKYAWKVLKGATLSRRERQQLVRTVSDLFRLLPFSIFIIVPFMELLLPVFIKLFPNMLPSTFQENNKEEEKIRKQVKMRVEMAKFLQDTIEELALERKAKSKKSTSSQALEFAQFMKKVRNEGGYVSNAEILKYSKLFEDELTLDNLSMGQLRSLCRLMSIQSLGSPEILRFQLNMKLRELKADDKQIAAEGGVDALNTLDLQQACRARGMRAIGLSEERLKDQLRQWLELSLNDNIPPSFLLLSRALYLPEDIAFTDRLKALVQNLPESIAEQTKVKLTEIEGGKVDHKERIDLLKQIENAIAKEKQIEDDENKLKEQQKKADEEKKIDSEKSAPNGGDDVAQTALDVSYDLRKKDEAVDMKLDRLDLSSIGKAITGDLIHEAKHKLNDLKEKAMEQSELLDNKKREGDLTGNKVARRLRSKLNNMIEGMDSLVSKLEEEKKHIEEILADPAVPDEVSKKEQKRVKIQDLINRLASLKNSDEHRKERIEQLLKSLDDDKDGFIDGKLVLEVIDILKQYNNVSISTSQLAELVGTLRKEGEVAISEEKKTKET